jgi:hypothetical protein
MRDNALFVRGRLKIVLHEEVRVLWVPLGVCFASRVRKKHHSAGALLCIRGPGG